MYNPHYLIKSRHSIYYFRYPMPSATIDGTPKRLSLSLKTRCHKEALQLAKILAYHSATLINRMDRHRMEHKEMMAMLKRYCSDQLDKAKAEIDADGPLSKQRAETLKQCLAEQNAVIDAEHDHFFDLLGVEAEDGTDPLEDALNKVMEHQQLSFAKDSREYAMLRQTYKHVNRNFCRDVLEYNQRVTDFSLLDTSQLTVSPKPLQATHALQSVMDGYLEEIKSDLKPRSFAEKADCLHYLVDWLGSDYTIHELDAAKAREVKGLLANTPKGRNKAGATAGKALIEQIAIAKTENLETLSNISVNKYLGYFEAFMDWAKNNHYVSDNPFAGMRVKAAKKVARRRDMFELDEVQKILMHLTDKSICKKDSFYWGALIAIFTGARRNEIAALLPDDIVYDEASNIWYFNITDEEEEGKEIKSEAARRVIPVHSYLLDRGLLDFVDESRQMGERVKNLHQHTPRLLYEFTYTEHEKWGRSLGRWFNENYLMKLGLKTKKKTLHSLRHSFITQLSIAGVESANIKSMVGHEADTVTTGVYTHYGAGHLPIFKDAIEQLPY